MKNGRTVRVDGSDLLLSALPCERFPMMRMEVRDGTGQGRVG
jgi:hypothetical protein